MGSIAAILEVVGNTIKIANVLIQTGKDAAPAVTAIKQLFAGNVVSQADLDKLAEWNDTMSAELQAPLPPEGQA